MSIRILVPAILLSVQGLFGAPREIVNDSVWLDTQGREILAQGGSILKVGRIYHWYGYDTSKNDVRLYTSPDLANWTFQEVVYHGDSWYGRPDVIYNARTGRYVLITEGPRSSGRNAVHFYTSDKAAGPFARQAVVDTVFGRTMGDHSVFKDTNSDAYLIAITDPKPSDINGGMTIAKLTPDYLGLESAVATWDNASDHREAPAIVKKDDCYYLFTSWTHGWNSTATKYQKSATLSGFATTSKHDLATIPRNSDSFNTQHDFILPVTGSRGTSYIYCGDRYSQFTRKGIGKNAWFPLLFDVSGNPILNGTQKWTIDVETGLWGAKGAEPQSTFRPPVLHE